MSGGGTSAGWWLGLAAGAGLLAAGATAYLLLRPTGEPPAVTPDATPPVMPGVDISASVHQFCGACHAYPPADTFPRSAWEKEVERGYQFYRDSDLNLQPPPIEAVIKYYEDRAPESLPPATIARATTPLGVRFEPVGIAGPPGTTPPAVSNVSLARLSDPNRDELLVCEMRWGLVMALRPWEETPSWRVLGKVSHPAHAEVVDLDGDGIKDILVADLGSLTPTDAVCGSVVWLRGRPDGGYTQHTLLKDVGRVADVQAADFRGVGKLDLIVAVFGWHKEGNIVYLENQTEDPDRPKFVPRVLDSRHGAIHVPVADLNGDGKPDFVALISQEHETIVAFLNEGGGKFRKKTLYTASHPGYGSSGIQLVDLNGDGKLDVLYTNGDVLDTPNLLKPYHSIQWLENKGGLRFEHHHLAAMYGVHRAVAADVDGDGDLDIVAVSFLPAAHFPQRRRKKLDSVVILEQTAPGRFARHTLESVSCDHVTCAAGNVFGTGRADLVIGNFWLDKPAPSLTVWKNLGKK
jgi:hypothetical protein